MNPSARAIASRFYLSRTHLTNVSLLQQSSSLHCYCYSTSATAKTKRSASAATSTTRLKNQPQKPLEEKPPSSSPPSSSSPKQWYRFAKVSETKSNDLPKPSENSRQTKVSEPKLKELPRPSEIPWQAKVVNSVNLIGHVQDPVRFREVSGGKHWASTILVQRNSEYSSDSSDQFSIPLVFEGDVAHVAACHLKEKDHVYVTGQLSVDPIPSDLEEENGGSGGIHLEVSSFNFIQGYTPAPVKKSLVESKQDEWDMYDANNCSSDLENDASLKQQEPEQVVVKPNDKLEKKDSTDLAAFRTKKNEDLQQSHVSWTELNSKKQEVQTVDRKKDQKSPKSGKPKNGVPAFDSWKDLLRNPKQWRDYRQKKADGSIKANYPDFKHKDSAQALWLENAPKWVLQGLDGLEFDDAQVIFKKNYVQVKAAVKKHKNEDSWKDLVENPDKWWDNRSNKFSAKAPDFKHKDSGEALWLNGSPDWVLPRLPPLRPKRNAAFTK